MYQVIISTQTFMDLTRPFYRPQGKVMFSEASVSHSVHNQPHGYLVTAHPCVTARSVCILLECFLVTARIVPWQSRGLFPPLPRS